MKEKGGERSGFVWQRAGAVPVPFVACLGASSRRSREVFFYCSVLGYLKWLHVRRFMFLRKPLAERRQWKNTKAGGSNLVRHFIIFMPRRACSEKNSQAWAVIHQLANTLLWERCQKLHLSFESDSFTLRLATFRKPVAFNMS